jgi:hypothetical protein
MKRYAAMNARNRGYRDQPVSAQDAVTGAGADARKRSAKRVEQPLSVPADLAYLLTQRGRDGLARLGRSRRPVVDRTSPIALLEGWISPTRARECMDRLDSEIADYMDPMAAPIPRSSITSMRQNYTEKLPKTVHVLSAVLDRPRSHVARVARRLGVVELLNSPTLRRVGEAATGFRLDDQPGMQILLYRSGDYSGPHNDHHPESVTTRGGFVDIHISLTSEAVAHQWLVYERRGHFSEIASVSTLGMISVYFLPFWHYTTPLVAKPNQHDAARRWVLMASYTIA